MISKTQTVFNEAIERKLYECSGAMCFSLRSLENVKQDRVTLSDIRAANAEIDAFIQLISGGDQCALMSRAVRAFCTDKQRYVLRYDDVNVYDITLRIYQNWDQRMELVELEREKYQQRLSKVNLSEAQAVIHNAKQCPQRLTALLMDDEISDAMFNTCMNMLTGD